MSEIMPNGVLPKSDWTDSDYLIFEEWLRIMLYSHTPEITFTKKDNSERKMKCSLHPSLLPPVLNESLITRKPKQSIIRVFDLEKQAWRSFDVHSVTNVKFNLTDITPIGQCNG